MGLEYFKRSGCEVVGLEVGLGGELDSTNIVTPLVSVITSIGLDHRESLGSNVYDIASKKIERIKKGD